MESQKPNSVAIETKNEALVQKGNNTEAVAESQDRACYDRWFGRMAKGSLRAGMLSLTATAIGGGIQVILIS